MTTSVPQAVPTPAPEHITRRLEALAATMAAARDQLARSASAVDGHVSAALTVLTGKGGRA